MSTFQKRWIIFSSSLFLALIQLMLIIFQVVYQLFGPSYIFGPGMIALLLFSGLIFLLIPFQVSLYITYRTRDTHGGSDTGGRIGCTGALLSVLFIILAGYIGMLTGFISERGGSIVFLLVAIFTVANVVFFCIALLGATLGSLFGKTLLKKGTPRSTRI